MNDLLAQYKAAAGKEIIDELIYMANILKGIKVVHVNSTKTGGGVAEILHSMVPLMNALGISALWEVIEGGPEFFEVTKQFHNALQGQKQAMPSLILLKNYEEVNAQNAIVLKQSLENADVVFIHDPQPAAIIKSFPLRKNKWIWRCHIDVSNPDPNFWNYLRTFVSEYDASVFSLKDYEQQMHHPIFIIPPSIDPLTEKNIDLSKGEIKAIYPRFELDSNRPMILQVSRFDYFKDPIGVIKAYKLAKKIRKDLQLVLAGGGAPDDPEGERVLKEVKASAIGDKDIHILYLPSDAHRTINALQRAADIVLQKSIKEGFGLTVTEALWKRKPVIGGNVGGIRLQLIDYKTGFLVDTPEEAAERIQYILQHPDVIGEITEKAHQFVYDKFLITRHLRDYLSLIISLLNSEKE